MSWAKLLDAVAQIAAGAGEMANRTTRTSNVQNVAVPLTVWMLRLDRLYDGGGSNAEL